MTHDTAETASVGPGYKGAGYAHGCGAKPPTDRNLGLTPSWQVGGLALMAAAALALGVWGLTLVDPQESGRGLLTVLPPTYYLALALSLAGFVVSLSLRRFIRWLMTWQILVLVLILHSVGPIIHGLPRFETSFRYLGIADHINRSGHLDMGLDAYLHWPGFFTLLGMLSGTTGVSDLTVIAAWAPVGITVVLLAPLLALATRLTSTPRQAWAGVWVFYLTSWVGQDYLAPQAYAFVLLLTLLALLLSVFSGWAWPTDRNRFCKGLVRKVSVLDGSSSLQGRFRPTGTDATILLVVCAAILMAMTVSHQLTPFVLVPFLAAFLLTGQLRLRLLPVLAVVLPVGWLLLAASAYSQGQAGPPFGSFDDVGTNALGAVSARATDSDAQTFAGYTRLAGVALVWVLAAVGAVTGYRRKIPWLTAAAGALAPLFLLLAQPSGGDRVLRLSLFSLPFAACLVVLPVLSGRSQILYRAGGLGVRQALVLLLLGGLLAVSTIVTRHGNESRESFSKDEIAVVDHLYARAPAGSILIEAVRSTPWKARHYADYDYQSLVPAQPTAGTTPLSCSQVNGIARDAGAYVIVTRSQHAAGLRGSTSAGDLQRFIDTCGASPGWMKVFENAGGVIFEVKGANNGE